MALATEAAPNRLWPQPWPASRPATGCLVGVAAWLRPGRASNSARMAITGPWPFLKLPTKPVGSPATPAFTVKPAALSWSWRRALLLVSR